MIDSLRAYAHWLHLGFPAREPEPLPDVDPAGRSQRPGILLAGDLLGTPLLKLAVESGAAAARAALDAPKGARHAEADLAVIGAGPAGLAAAIEAKARGARVVLLDARGAASTVRDFPQGKPILLVPHDHPVDAVLSLAGDDREALLAHLEGEVRRHALEIRVTEVVAIDGHDGAFELRDAAGEVVARAAKVVVALGTSGARRALGVPGEDAAHVRNHLHDPATYAGRRVVVVGGGDTAVEAACALAEAGAMVSLVHRGDGFPRTKAETRGWLARLGDRVHVRLGAQLDAIEGDHVRLRDGARLDADDVFVLVGRDPPRARLQAFGLLPARRPVRDLVRTLVLPLAIAAFLYTWKSGGALTAYFAARGWFPFGLPDALGLHDTTPLGRTLRITLAEPGFHYAALYTALVLGFGALRVARTDTPYVRRQTAVLAAVQVVPLFLLPYLVLPYLGAAGVFDDGLPRAFADAFFPIETGGHGRAYWRAFGFVLAFPLFLWNVLTHEPMVPWLVVSAVQTFVVIPYLVRRFGKGAYCGFICSCGALAETVGDGLRTRMPKGPRARAANLVGQAILAFVALLLLARIVSWVWPGASLLGVRIGRAASLALYGHTVFGVPFDYAHLVDLGFAGILGVGLYIRFSGRVWCRFGCPLAALMHVYARAFSRFRIETDDARCIGCDRCTRVCHQGIDVAHRAIRGEPVDDPQCVRCSACVAACPTAALTFVEWTADGPVADRLESSPVRLRADGKRGLRVLA